MLKVFLNDKCWQDLEYWTSNNPRTVPRIIRILREISKTPTQGIGKPEALKENLRGYWSRRINDVDRIVYKIEKDQITVISIKGHYDSINLN